MRVDVTSDTLSYFPWSDWYSTKCGWIYCRSFLLCKNRCDEFLQSLRFNFFRDTEWVFGYPDGPELGFRVDGGDVGGVEKEFFLGRHK